MYNLKHFGSGATFVLILWAATSFAQSAQWSMRTHMELGEAQELIEQQKYDLAAGRYEDVLKHETHPKAQYLSYMGLAEIHTLQGELEAAAAFYEHALVIDQPEDDARLLQIAEVFLASGKLDRAFDSYQAFAQANPTDERPLARIGGLNERDRFFEKEEDFEVEVLSISSAHADFSPVLFDGGVAFLSGRAKALFKKKDRRTNSAYLAFYHSSLSPEGLLSVPTKMMPGKIKFNEGPMTHRPSDGSLILTRNVCKPSEDKGAEETFVLQLLEIKPKDNGKWSKPTPLSINDRNYSFGHPSLSQDETTLYFVSDMPGGYGGTDVYRSVWDGTDWSDPVNMGAKINSAGDEMFPYVHKDETLYFASNGHAGLGGLDIYRVPLFGEQVVSNMGHPVNSPKDDFSLVLEASDTVGYFASSRSGGMGEDDLYRLTLRQEQPKPVEPLMADLAVELPDTLILARKEPEMIPPPEVTRDLLQDEIVGFTVQILAMEEPDDIQRKYFGPIKDIVFYDGKDGLRRYTHGIYPTFAQAMVAMKKIRELGIDDAFVRGLKRYEELSIQKYPVAFEAIEE